MDFFQWISKEYAQAVTVGLIIGLLAASVRGFKMKDSPKAFFIRMYCGGVMAGLTALALSMLPPGLLKTLPIPLPFEIDVKIEQIIYGALIFTAGFYGAEWGASVAKITKDKMEETLYKEKEDETDTKS